MQKRDDQSASPRRQSVENPKHASPPSSGEQEQAGRPRIIGSPEEMNRRLDEYLAACEAEKEPVTMTGLVQSLGLSSRQSLDEYRERGPGFSASVKRAKLAVEHAYERRMATATTGGAVAGAIFALKNMGWSDRHEVELRGGLASIDVTRLTDEQLARIRAGEHPLAVLASAQAPQLAPPAPVETKATVSTTRPAREHQDGEAER